MSPALLGEGVIVMREVFGRDTAISIEDVIDPDDGTVTTACYALWKGTVEQGAAKLREFDEKWWLDHCQLVGGELQFYCQFV